MHTDHVVVLKRVRIVVDLGVAHPTEESGLVVSVRVELPDPGGPFLAYIAAVAHPVGYVESKAPPLVDPGEAAIAEQVTTLPAIT